MLKLIKNNQHYESALARAYFLMQKDLKPDSKESDELELFLFLSKNMKMNIIQFRTQAH